MTSAIQLFKTIGFGFAFSPLLRVNVFEAIPIAAIVEAKLVLLHLGEKNTTTEKQI